MLILENRQRARWIVNASTDTVLLDTGSEIIEPGALAIWEAEFEGRIEVSGFAVTPPSDDIPTINFSRFPMDLAVVARGSSSEGLSLSIAGGVGKRLLDILPPVPTQIILDGCWFLIDRDIVAETADTLAGKGIPITGRINIGQLVWLRGKDRLPVPFTDLTVDTDAPGSNLPKLGFLGLRPGTELFDYQEIGVSFLAAVARESLGCVLADEMGLIIITTPMKTLLSFYKYNLLSAMEYRTSFLVLVVFMILNDTFFLSIWYFFFQKFPTIRGVSFEQFIPLLAMFVLIFAIMHIFFNGYRRISAMVSEGQLDNHLLLPGNLLLRILSSSLDTSAIGDLIYAFLLLFLVPNVTVFFVAKMFLFAFFGTLVFVGFMVAVHSLSFHLGNIGEFARAMFEGVLGPSHYPPQIFEGTFLKFLFMTALPVYFVGFLPYNLLMHFEWRGFLVLVLASIVSMSLGTFAFYRGLRRYESGNAMGVNG